jgi:hypothetical protein
MIYESYIYKDELLKIADRMDKRLMQKRWTEHSLFLLEKDTFSSFFIIRKLIEAQTKLTIETSEMMIDLKKYLPTGMKPTIKNNHKIDRLYALETSHKCKRKISDICGDIIHSYILEFIFKDVGSVSNLDLIYFNSFNHRDRGLYSLAVTEFIKILRTIGNDYPASMGFIYNERKEDYDIFTNERSYLEKVNGESKNDHP